MRAVHISGDGTPEKTLRQRFDVPLTSNSAMAARPKPYRQELTPLPSALRPHCLAKDRLRLWRPSAAQADRDGIAWTDQEFDRLIHVTNLSWGQGTRETYGAGLLIYHIYCDMRSIAEDARCPVLPLTMSMFIASCAGSYSGSTLTNYTCGVRAWHIMHGAAWNMDLQVRAALDGAAKLAPPASKKGPRTPMTISMLEALNAQLDPTLPLDVSVRAALNIMFYSLARTGELTIPSLKSFDPDAHVKPEDLRADTDRNGLPVQVAHLPRTKASPATGEDIYFAAQEGPSNPAAALQDHQRVNAPPRRAHLFAYRTGGGHKPLTRSAFLKRLNEAALAMNLNHIKGHSVRIGGTLEFLLRGVAFEVVKTLGRWSSDAFVLYLRKHAVILAPYIQSHPVLVPFTEYTMPPVR